MITFWFFLFTFFLETTTVLKREIVFFLYLLLPGLYFIETQVKNKKIIYPKKITVIYLLFIFFGLISFYFSVDKINSFDHLLYYFSAFFVFVLVFNEKEKILPRLKKILIILGILFSLISFLPKNFFPPTAYQLVFPFYGNNNHLGEFLGMVILWLVYDFLVKNEKRNLYLTIFFLPFFLFSYSRTAYFDFFVVGGLLILSLKKQKKIKLKVICFIFFLVVSFFIFSQKQTYQIPFLKPVLPLAEKYLKVQPRDIWSGRPEYFLQAIKGFLEKPVFGWGSGNFIYPSNKYVGSNLQQVSSALNLPLTTLTELGIFGFLAFLYFVLTVFLKKDPKEKIVFYLFLYLSLNFLTDYTYSIYGLFLFWFVLMGLVISKEKEKEFFLYPLFSFIVLILLFVKLTAGVLNLSGNYSWSFKFFPLTHKGFQNVITNYLDQGKKQEAFVLATKYNKTSLISFEALSFLADFNQSQGNKKQALEYRLKLLDIYRYPPFDALKKTYLLEKEIKGKEKADWYFMKTYPRLEENFWFSPVLKNEVWQFCKQEDIVGCRLHFFYEPDPNTIEKSEKEIPYRATYTFNNDGLNERFNYAVKKPKDVFRIMVLGDGDAFGFLVDTKDNWTEKLEDILNKEQTSLFLPKSIKKIEVINLSYHSYDLAYAVERLRIRGLKYQPDLIIWQNSNFSRDNEVFLPIAQKIDEQMKGSGEDQKQQKKGNYFSSWDKAYEEYDKLVKEEEIEAYQTKYLSEFFALYTGRVVFVSFYNPPQKVKEAFEKKKVQILDLSDFLDNKNYYFKNTGSINVLGHQQLAKNIFSFLQENLKSL